MKGNNVDCNKKDYYSKHESVFNFFKRLSPVLLFLSVIFTMGLCIAVRLFAVVRYEAIIHEFDPHFNYRTSQYLSNNGFYAFWNWFDSRSWYPLGRPVGQTLFPGLMLTADFMRRLAHQFGILVSIRHVCVFTGPIMSSLSALASYLLVYQVNRRNETGMLAALFTGISPTYLSRSVAGSYDNEAVAIFALIISFALYLRAINDGRILSSLLASLAYNYMTMSWGGYVFIINTIAIYNLILVLLNRFTFKHYVVYTVFYLVGTILNLNIPFVGIGAIKSSEHLSSHCLAFLVTCIILLNSIKALLSRSTTHLLIKILTIVSFVSVCFIFILLTISGKTRWAARSMTLLDPTYASKHVPIVASVSEHQATTWSQYIFDLHITAIFFPLGVLVCAYSVYISQKNTPLHKSLSQSFSTCIPDTAMFLAVYGVLAVYFSSVMIRLMLVLGPASCCLSAIGLSFILSAILGRPKTSPIEETPLGQNLALNQYSKSQKENCANESSNWLGKYLVAFILFVLCIKYVTHSIWSSAVAYSHPSVITSNRLKDGTRLIQDDFREAYYWLRKNTPYNARIMSWWDYGYQCTELADRTVIVDNNTWNTTHIATVGLALASPEEEAFKIMEKLDVDYIFVVFGGFARYTSDDINKFLWMVRIASGVYPQIQQNDYISESGYYTVGNEAPKAMLNSLIYKLSYYRFAEVQKDGFDMARNYNIGKTHFTLSHFEEVYTTDNWIVRIYKVKKRPNRI
ncbi:oligosaccharyl transferase STT3 subunit family protein [Cryptosporidium andersoni]|uniref:dolichyl-diphosphooligosaccharide--protein glycotransferase n=1 Tax=Cryptosporidium andersoni TaxID=117008 RepID=A0A1J4MPW7_9CRYT|nr:oligosaccharyl transferase STT3 subunit family protein [Cryptosporidium andersoni]